MSTLTAALSVLANSVVTTSQIARRGYNTACMCTNFRQADLGPEPQDAWLYAHVPFCRSKCGYCDFYSRVDHPDAYEPLIQAMLDELNTATSRPGLWVETIYVGGGTPTVLPVSLLASLLGRLREVARQTSADLPSVNKGLPAEPSKLVGRGLIEFTVEANPATVDQAKAEILAQCGVNRVSMGAQSFDERELASLGREHKPADVAATAEVLRRAGITQYNIDLIFGIPGQTIASWRHSLQAAIDAGPDHISCYGLTYESGTPLYEQMKLGLVLPVQEELEADLYAAAIDVLEAAGYRQYEISNFAQPGRECRHNLRYWHNQPGIGIGPSAASYWAGHRWRNVPDTAEYVALIRQGRSTAIDDEKLAPLERAGETAMLNLRLTEGIRRQPFRLMTGFDPLDLFEEVVRTHSAGGLLAVDSQGIALTRRGRVVADAVIADFLRPQYTEPAPAD